MPTSAAGNKRRQDALVHAHPRSWRARQASRPRRGFTLIELMVVIAVIAIGTAAASLALRDSAADALARDGERLAALLEAARSRSRAAGVPVRWRPTENGFVFEGLPPSSSSLPTHWLDPQTVPVGNAPLLLGPDPLIGAQMVQIHRAGTSQPLVSIATDGLRPFTVSMGGP